MSTTRTPDNFWSTVERRAADAHASGAMHSFESVLEFIADGGVEFVVRRATRYPPGETAAGKAKPGTAEPPRDPFMSPEAALVVAEVSATHVVLLNKYNVVRGHVLLVTRDYVDQRVLLDLADFEALASCMNDAALAFYNGGPGSGASQPHKHLQLVSLPLSPHASVPIAALVGAAEPALPFQHAVARLAPGDLARPGLLLQRYRDLFEALGLPVETRDGVDYQTVPYNLVLVSDWMLLVPRSKDVFEGVSINGLAFAGSLFARSEGQMQAIRRFGPMQVLRGVAL